MMYLKFVLTCIVAISALGKGIPQELNSHRSVPVLEKVGMTTRNFVDTQRSNWLGTGPRPLRTLIWYPTSGGGREEVITDIEQFPKPVTLVQEGKITARASKYPLIILSHGSQGNAKGMRWLGYTLAAQGYIVAAINHNGTPEEERQTGPLTLSDYCIWERPRDVSVVIDQLVADQLFASKIDQSRIGVGGHSLGGATAIWVAGARLDLERLQKNSPPPPAEMVVSIQKHIELTKNDPLIQQSILRAEDSYKDERIKAVFVLAPAIGCGFTKESLSQIAVPVQIVVGADDKITPSTTNAQHYADCITGAKLIVLPGEVGHYTKKVEGVEHAVELQQVSQLAYEFFEQVLGKKK